MCTMLFSVAFVRHSYGVNFGEANLVLSSGVVHSHCLYFFSSQRIYFILLDKMDQLKNFPHRIIN